MVRCQYPSCNGTVTVRLRSPENAVRLLAALTRARRGRKKPTDLATLFQALERGP